MTLLSFLKNARKKWIQQKKGQEKIRKTGKLLSN